MTRSIVSNPKPGPRLPESHAQFAFEAIGTQWRIDLFESLSEAAREQVERAVRRRIELFDKHYSRFRSDSLVSRMARQGGRYRLPDDARPMFDLYAELYQQTNGVVTPLVGQLLADAGYDAQYSLQPGRLRRPPAWHAALAYEFPYLTLHQPVLLDFGAAGKGRLVDIISMVLRRHRVQTYAIDAGGDILHRGPVEQSLHVGLEHPGNPQQMIGVAVIANQSLCASATNRRAWGAFHHIINPHTLNSPRHIRAVWVVAQTAMLADALATCLFFVPASQLLARYTFEYAIVADDWSLTHSAHFPATFFTEEDA